MIQIIFDWAVKLLIILADFMGMTYEAINVWLFVFLWPLITLGMLAVILWQRQKMNKFS